MVGRYNELEMPKSIYFLIKKIVGLKQKLNYELMNSSEILASSLYPFQTPSFEAFDHSKLAILTKELNDGRRFCGLLVLEWLTSLC